MPDGPGQVTFMNSTGKRIAIVGAGGVGGYCAARLARAGHDVWVVDQGAHLDAIRAHGLRVETPDEQWLAKLPASDRPADIEPVDVVVVSVQSQDTEGVAGSLRPLLHDSTTVIPLQNNVDNPERLAAALGPRHVLAAAVFIAASRPEPGLVRQLAPEVKIYLGELDGQDTPRVRALATMLSEAGLPSVATRDIRKEMWRKFVFNIGYYLTGPLEATAAEVLDLEDTRTLHQGLISEAAAVAAALGVELGEADLAEIVEVTRSYGHYIPSTVQKLRQGQADEGQHFFDTITRLGRQAGVATPMCQAVLAFVRFMNQRNKRRRSTASPGS